jgi:hypothetical protein
MRWPYTRRPDGRIAVTLDNNAWDFLFETRIVLASEFPADRFALFIPREVEIESSSVPDRKAVREYIRQSIEAANVITTSVLGFDTGEIPQRRGSLSHGTFQSPLEAEVHEELRRFVSPKKMGSGLMKNEGDAAVAVSSLFSVVLTAELPEKRGPLRFVRERGGKIVYLRSPSDADIRLREQVIACHRQD